MRQIKITSKITKRDSIALEKYLNDISKIDLITPEEETAIARRIREGDESALAELTQANLRFVVSVAKQYQNNGLSLSDLINEGNVGLLKAARRFDETKGFKFISYAVWWIRQAILHAIVEYSRMVRLPVNKMNKYKMVMEAHRSFTQLHEREPTLGELAELCEISETEAETIWNGRMRYTSFDAPMSGDENDLTMMDIMPDQGASPDIKLMEESLKIELNNGLSVLSPREYEILCTYYGLNGRRPHSLEEIADLYDLTRERVRQIRERALRRIRRKINNRTFYNS